MNYIKELNFATKTTVEALLDYYLIFPIPENITYQKESDDILNIFVREY